MAVRDLATNAAVHGALPDAQGWRAGPEPFRPGELARMLLGQLRHA